MTDKSFLKMLIIFSMITGAIISIITLIPPIMWLAFTILMFFTGPFVLIYLKKLNLIKTINTQAGLIIGSISGACSFIGFSIIFFPVAFILQLIFKIQAYIWVKVVFFNIGFLIPMIILTALISALLNAFSGFLISYCYEYLKTKK